MKRKEEETKYGGEREWRVGELLSGSSHPYIFLLLLLPCDDHHLDSVKRSKVLIKVILVDGGAALWWHPELLRAAVNLNLVDPRRAHSDDKEREENDHDGVFRDKPRVHTPVDIQTAEETRGGPVGRLCLCIIIMEERLVFVGEGVVAAADVRAEREEDNRNKEDNVDTHKGDGKIFHANVA